jgi:hypothetical protein
VPSRDLIASKAASAEVVSAETSTSCGVESAIWQPVRMVKAAARERRRDFCMVL